MVLLFRGGQFSFKKKYFYNSFRSATNTVTTRQNHTSVQNTSPKVRVRYAPSPTGYLHLGGLRTALFNYALAKQARSKESHPQQSAFILRIEDTDAARTVPGSIPAMIKALHWCGLEFDEGPILIPASPLEATSESVLRTKSLGTFGPYIQSERLLIYRKYVDELVEKGAAYPCFCSSSTLAEKRDARIKKGLPSVYDRTCRSLPRTESETRVRNGESHVIRLVVPPVMPDTQSPEAVLTDEVLGLIRFSLSSVDDQVLLKSDGFPTYHLASVIDDHLMEISHVIRGQEWLSSTPKHLLLYSYFGWKAPLFSHLPLLLNASDRSKLSKRQGDVSVEDFRASGYLPEALLHFVSHLGWTPPNGINVDENGSPDSIEKTKKKAALTTLSPLTSKKKSSGKLKDGTSGSGSGGGVDGGEGRMMKLDEFVQLFSIKNVNKGNAVVDRNRLDFLNSIYLRARLKSLKSMDNTSAVNKIDEDIRSTVYQLLDKSLEKLNNNQDINDNTHITNSLSLARQRVSPKTLDELMILVHERAIVVLDLAPLILPYVVTEDEFDKLLEQPESKEAARKLMNQVDEGIKEESVADILIQPSLRPILKQILFEWKLLSNDDTDTDDATKDFSVTCIATMKQIARENVLNVGELMMKMRILLTGRGEGVGMKEILKALGKDKVIKRLERGLKGV